MLHSRFVTPHHFGAKADKEESFALRGFRIEFLIVAYLNICLPLASNY